MIVGIRGSGIAAAGCAHLLRRAGLRVASEAAPRRPVPTVMLGAPALTLLRSIFGRPDLLADAPRIRRRVVAWGGPPVIVPHDAVLASETALQTGLSGLQREDLQREAGDQRAGDQGTGDQGNGDQDGASIDQADFMIHAALPMPMGAPHSFGDRNAVAAKVRLLDASGAQEGRIEAVANGWLFLVPASCGEGWLLGVGGAIDDLLAQSHLIAPVVDPVGATSLPFVAAPHLHMSLCGQDWLACGTAVLGFDPICGDGTAQSAREAILASAVLTAIADGGDRQALLTHYQSMLLAAMRRHLQLCAQYYGNGGQGDWWRSQHAALMQGYDWCTGLLATMPQPRFMLRDFRLVPRQETA